MKRQGGQHNVRKMCRWLCVSPSGYYAWKRRRPSARRQQNERLTIAMRAIDDEVRQSYGSPRMQRELIARGHACGRHRVARLMRDQGLQARFKKRYKVTTQAGHHGPAPDRLKRRFKKMAPNRAWVSDITAIPTAEGWLYLATVLDLYSRRIVGWATGDRMHTGLVIEALNHAAGRRTLRKGWIFHSDRGTQYMAQAFKERLKELEGLPSMGRRGTCYDNAVAESFFASLKEEWLRGKRYKTRQEALSEVFGYIEMHYNPIRRHSTLGYVSPVEFERQAGVVN
jgi:putative transposase